MLKFGIIGTGRISGRFVSEIKRLENVSVEAVFNPNIESAHRFADQEGIQSYTDTTEKLYSIVDAVYIASPHETHYQYAKEMLEQGKHVLCEKPMTFEKKQAIELFHLAAQHNCVLLEALKTSFCPGFQAMIKMAKSGVIGDIKDVEACFTRLTPTNLREVTDEKYGGSFTEFASYTLLPVIKLLGSGYNHVSFQSLYAANGVDIYTKASFEYEDAMALSKTGLAVKSEGQLVIAGTKGYILCDSPWWLTKKFQVRYEDSQKIEEYTYPYENFGLRYEIETFVNAIEGQCDNIALAKEDSIAISGIMELFLNNNIRNLDFTNKNKDMRIWAHRGCSRAYPENTLEAFEAASKLPGLTGIELDVQLSGDGEVVVIHDENVKRTTDGIKNVRDYTLNDLKKLKISKKDGTYATIPLLKEVFELLAPSCIKNGLMINIEFKTNVFRYDGIEKKTLDLVKSFELQNYIVYSSFLPESIKLIKELEPNAKTGMLAFTLKDCIELQEFTGADSIHPCIENLYFDKNRISNDTPIRAWNCTEPFYGEERVLKEKNLRKYAGLGVTDVFTNLPENYL